MANANLLLNVSSWQFEEKGISGYRATVALESRDDKEFHGLDVVTLETSRDVYEQYAKAKFPLPCNVVLGSKMKGGKPIATLKALSIEK